MVANLIGSKSTFIIAEAGVNHNGDIGLAKALIDAAKESGADAVKFQTFSADRVISRFAAKIDYQKKSLQDRQTQLEMLRSLELDENQHKILFDHAKKKNILFLSTPKDIQSADFLNDLGVDLFKIGSPEIIHHAFLEKVASFQKPIILSTGMSSLAEVDDAVKSIVPKNKDLVLLHCVSQYPCPIDQINLRAMVTLRQAFGYPSGFSDHSQGFEASVAAVALGACVIEKHFTLDTEMPGPDHKASLDPKGFSKMVHSIRNIERCLGDGLKKPAPCEMDNRILLRRGLVFARDLKQGHSVELSDLEIKRPLDGLSPQHKKIVVGRALKFDVLEDQPVTWENF